MLLHKYWWSKLSSEDKRTWLIGAIIDYSETISKDRQKQAFKYITAKFRSLPELLEYFEQIEEEA